MRIQTKRRQKLTFAVKISSNWLLVATPTPHTTSRISPATPQHNSQHTLQLLPASHHISLLCTSPKHNSSRSPQLPRHRHRMGRNNSDHSLRIQRSAMSAHCASKQTTWKRNATNTGKACPSTIRTRSQEREEDCEL